jgi:hypothetical protein
MKNLKTLLLLTIFVASFVCLPRIVLSAKMRLIEQELSSIAQSAHRASLPPGLYSCDKLPDGKYRFIKGHKESDEFTVRMSQSHRVAILWKRSPGWHHNYRGFVFIENGFPEEVGAKDAYERDVVGVDFGEISPVLRRRVWVGLYEVFMDLG